ncbi:MAG TPA: HD domain-containing protein [Kofleriaceae bacterium]|nr:HD domain-containing protein [Kofleriaceae bacterium]
MNGDELVERARARAIAAHGDQRYGDQPYRVHLEHVEEVVRRFPHTPVMRAAAWLHDAVEDTPLTIEEVAAELGDEVAAIVAAVTDQPGANRKERKARTLAVLRAASPEARAVKLADRIANLEASRRNGRDDLFAMYVREHVELRRQLHVAGEHDAQWTLLESLVG